MDGGHFVFARRVEDKKHLLSCSGSLQSMGDIFFSCFCFHNRGFPARTRLGLLGNDDDDDDDGER